MLSKVLGFNLIDSFQDASEGVDSDSLLKLLLPHYCNKAIRKGYYKKYSTNFYNDSNVKGSINIPEHIKSNTPFFGNVTYKVREFEYDNSLNWLIRLSIEYVLEDRSIRRFFNSNQDFLQLYKELKELTPNYKKQNSSKIIRENKVNILVHWHFNEYRELQKLCIKILERKSLVSSDSK